MSRTRIKICGICSVEDAQLAVLAGADAIGMVFYEKSPRFVSVDAAKMIQRSLPPFVTSVGLFVNSTEAEVEQILSQVELDLLQFHGDEPELYCQNFSRPYIKALRINKGQDINALCQQYSTSKGLLLDSYKKGVPGGTGETFDWALIPHEMDLPVILAGGLCAENIVSAITAVRPWAVDVSSGVERSPGIKDSQKISQFIQVVDSTGH